MTEEVKKTLDVSPFLQEIEKVFYKLTMELYEHEDDAVKLLEKRLNVTLSITCGALHHIFEDQIKQVPERNQQILSILSDFYKNMKKNLLINESIH